MSDLIIPDIILVDCLNNGLKAIRTDYNSAVAAGNEQNSILYLMYNCLALGKYIVYDNLKNLIINTTEDPRFIDVKLSYDHDSQKPISVHISLPSESDKNNSLSIGQGDNEEQSYDANNDGLPETNRAIFSRRFQSTYHVVIVSDNKNEVIVLYSLFKMLIIASINHLELSGLQNIKLGGGDVRLNEGQPERRFIRPITISFEYETVAPELIINAIISQFTYQVTLLSESKPHIEISADANTYLADNTVIYTADNDRSIL